MNEDEELINKLRQNRNLIKTQEETRSDWIMQELQNLRRDTLINDANKKAREEAEKELQKIKEAGRVTPTDFISDTRGVNNSLELIAKSVAENGPIDFVKKGLRANNKETQTLINYYDAIADRLQNHGAERSYEENLKDKATLDAIQKELQRQNNNLFSMRSNLENSTLRGAQSFVSGLENAGIAAFVNSPQVGIANNIINWGASKEEKEANKQSLYDALTNTFTRQGDMDIQTQQKLNELAYDGLMKHASNAGFTIGNMAIPILAGIATGGIATEAGATAATANNISKFASLGSMYTSVYGNSFKEAIEDGADMYHAQLYAHAMAGIEAGTELIGGDSMLSLMTGRPTASLLGKAASGTVKQKIRSKTAAAFLMALTDIGGESVEEAISAVADPIARKTILGGEDIKVDDLLADAYQDAVGALLPSLIFAGVGKPVALYQINNAELRTINDIRNTTSLTTDQKGELIRKIQEISSDARLGINENYDKIRDSIYNDILESQQNNVNVMDNALAVQRLTGISDADTLRLAESQGFVYNPTRMTTQEILDSTTRQTTNYSEAITKDIESILASDKSLNKITPVTETNKAKQNIANVVSGLTDGQVVFANIETNNGTKVYGLTNGTNIYINAELNDKDTLAAAFHELGHIYAKKNPQEFEAYENAFYKENKNAEQILKDYNNTIGKYETTDNLTEEQKNYLLEELFGDYVGQTMSQTKNTKTLEDSKKNMFDKLKQYGDELKSKYLGTERNNTDVSEYNLDEASYLDTELVSDENLENQVVGMFTDKPEETTKSIFKLVSVNSPREAQENDVYDRIEQRYKDMKGKESPVAIKKMVANELGKEYNALNEDREVKRIYADLKDNGEITRTGVKFSAKKNPNELRVSKNLSNRKESNTEKIINNQRNEIETQQEKIDNLEAENKGLKKIIKGIKSTGRQQIKNVQSESNKMLKTGREQELKMKGQLEREGKKYNKLSEAAIDIKYENQLAEKARADGINFPREYKDLFIGLRRAGDSIKVAYAATKSIFDESQVVNRSIDNSISILKEIRKRKLYNKLPNDIKAKINEYDKIWAGSRQQSNLTLAKRILASLKAREMLGNIAMTKRVRNQIMSMEGYGWENGKGSVSLQELFNESKELAIKFEQGLIALREEIKNFQGIDKNKERAMQIKDTIGSSQEAVLTEEKKQDKLKIKGLTKKVTNKTLFNSLMTLKTEIQAVMGGNINTPLMAINDNLQNGELRKKQAIVEMYRILSDFMKKSSGVNRVLNTQRWSKSLEKSLSNSSEWIDTGYKVKTERGKTIELKLPRSMAMSLAMHLLNDDNMLHISGGAVQITVDDNGNVDVKRGEGKGVRIPNEELFRRGKEKEAYDRGATVKLTHEQVEKIASMLTEEEKAFVKATQEVFKYTTELINEVSNRVFGYDLATVENYFPIRVWDKGEGKGAVINAPMQKMYGDALSHMLNPGWLQQRVTSFNPIYLENIAEVLNRTMNNVANFYGYAEALRDNHLILDSTMADGTEFSKHIDYLSSDFMSDYNRLTRFITGQEALRDGKFRGLMAMNTLTFNVGTWLTQPMSFFNTLKYFNSKEFLSGINPINNNIKLNSMIRNYFKELGIDDTKYDDYQVARAFIAMATPNLDYRALGYKIPELSQLFSKTMQQKLGAHGIEAFDNIAVTAIARMMAYSVSLDKSIKFGSEKYFEVLGDRLTKALVETQPEYSQINRANMFRSTNPVLRTLSMFGTPANQMFNNFAQSMMELRYELREGNKEGIKTARVDLAKSISGIILSSVMVGLIRALRDKIRDDDDEVDFTDRWIAQSTIAALGPTLVLDDLAQLIMSTNNFGGVSSYDFNTPETTFLNGFSNLYNKSMQLFKEDVSPAKKTTDLIKAIGVITPIDTKDVIRVTTMLMKTMAPDMYSAYKLQQDSTVYKKWLENPSTDMATFYKVYTNTRNKVLEEKYGYHKADKAKGIKSNLKEAREKALKDVLKNQKEVDKYMELLFNYKKEEG